MLSFEQVTKKDVLHAHVFPNNDSRRVAAELWYTPKFSGDSQIVNDDYKTLLVDEKLRVLKDYGLSIAEYDQIVQDLQETKPVNPDYDRNLKKCYLDLQQTINNKLKREFAIDKGDEHVIKLNYDTSKPRQNYIISVFGAPGAGKSYSVMQTILSDPALFHYPKVFLIGAVGEDDPSYEPLKNKLKAKYEYHNTSDLPHEMYEMDFYPRGSCIIFDDISSESDKKRKQAVLLMRERMLSICRHKSLRIISTEHQFFNYRTTAKMRNNSKWVFVFPRSIPKTFLDILEHTFSWRRNKRNAMLKLVQADGRLVVFHFAYPQFFMSPKRIVLL